MGGGGNVSAPFTHRAEAPVDKAVEARLLLLLRWLLRPAVHHKLPMAQNGCWSKGDIRGVTLLHGRPGAHGPWVASLPDFVRLTANSRDASLERLHGKIEECVVAESTR
jgi:hypothetical protein